MQATESAETEGNGQAHRLDFGPKFMDRLDTGPGVPGMAGGVTNHIPVVGVHRDSTQNRGICCPTDETSEGRVAFYDRADGSGPTQILVSHKLLASGLFGGSCCGLLFDVGTGGGFMAG